MKCKLPVSRMFFREISTKSANIFFHLDSPLMLVTKGGLPKKKYGRARCLKQTFWNSEHTNLTFGKVTSQLASKLENCSFTNVSACSLLSIRVKSISEISDLSTSELMSFKSRENTMQPAPTEGSTKAWFLTKSPNSNGVLISLSRKNSLQKYVETSMGV